MNKRTKIAIGLSASAILLAVEVSYRILFAHMHPGIAVPINYCWIVLTGITAIVFLYFLTLRIIYSLRILFLRKKKRTVEDNS